MSFIVGARDFSHLLSIRSFVYFLKKNDEIVYVGSTNNGFSRPLSHVGFKDFNGIEIIECNPSELLEIESYYICNIKPRYNKHPGIGKYISINEAKRVSKLIIGDFMTMRLTKSIIENHGVQSVVFQNIVYVDKSAFYDACNSEARILNDE